MSATAVPASSLDFLDALMASDEIWVQGAEEGRAVAEHVVGSKAPIVVLYGPAGAGSTEFMRRWVLPVLEERGRVTYHGRGETAFAPQDGEAIEVWDGFETCLSDASSSRDALLHELAKRSLPDRGAHKFVLVVQEDYLNRLFQLRSVVPGILDDLYEIPTMPASRFIDALARTTATYQMQIDDACRATLALDLDAVRTKAALGPELVAILGFELYRSRTASTEFTKRDYEALGGLSGILEAHLEFLFEHLPEGIDADIGWAVLHQTLRTPVDVATDLTDIAARYDVGLDVPGRVLSWLEKDRRVLRANTGGGHDIVPGLLAAGVENRMRRVEETTEYVRGALRHAVRQFADFSEVLPDQQFRRINTQRSSLIVNGDEATLMLRCALGYAQGHLGNAMEHWLRRVRNASATVEILLDALFDARPDVRGRAAACLRDFNTADVRAQLHLVALRDADQAVRTAAVDSLHEIGNAELRASLVQETRDPNSPFRLQAIDALRIFTDQDTVDALVNIVSGAGPGDDPAARTGAIDALGAHSTPQSMSALVTIALQDKDREDRAAAARAIGRVASPESASVALAALQDAHKASRTFRPSFSWSALGRGALSTAMAIGAVLVNCLVHGFILATIGRRRSAAAVIAVEAVIVTVALRVDSAAIGLFFLTWAAGYVVPTRALLLERQEGVNQSRYRRAVGVALFAAGCVTGFLLVHGLPSMLTRQLRRGLLLTVFEGAGIGLIISSYVFWNELRLDVADLRPIFWWTTRAAWLLYYTGIAVVVMTYLLGVGSALLDMFAWRRRRETDRRLDLVYHQLLPNPRASALVLGEFCGSDPDTVRSSTAIVRRYPKVLRPQLGGLWEKAGALAKRRILAAMARRPDADSVEFLRSVCSTYRGRIRAALALWNLRLSMWPRPVLCAALLGLVTLGLYTAVLREGTQTTAAQLIEIAKNPDTTDENAVRAIGHLGILATSGPPRLSGPAASELQRALSDAGLRENAERASAIVSALPAGTGIDPIENGLTWLLESPSTRVETREAALDALEQMRTSLAAVSLRHFVEGAGSERRGSGDDVSPLRYRAIAALATMTKADVAPLRALVELQSSPAIPEEFQQAAREAARGADSLAWLEYYLERSKFDEAIAAGRAAKPSDGDDQYAQRIANALARAHAVRGLAALNKPEPDYPKASADLSQALAVGAGPGNLTEAIALGQQLAFALHERAFAYEESYRVNASMLRHSAPFGERFATVLDASVAESALTSGKYGEAHSRALEVVKRAGPDPELSATVLSMRLIAAAALALQNDDAGAQRLVKEALDHHAGLPSGFTNTWEYTGTLRYLDAAPLSPQTRTALKNAFNQISRAQPGQ